MNPYAARYGGHQFGHWAGQLGDGRAITLGEFSDTTNHVWELQLKGAGRTPYSRNADGRAVLRSSLREFLCSEAMHHLGVPTTRALSIVLTGDQVLRDMFYDGNAAEEPGAITSRLAPSFLRFGNFQILEDCGEFDLLKKLADYWFSHELISEKSQTIRFFFTDSISQVQLIKVPGFNAKSPDFDVIKDLQTLEDDLNRTVFFKNKVDIVICDSRFNVVNDLNY
jgi:uncharacterized protein YdiU (UPF0061 family)